MGRFSKIADQLLALLYRAIKRITTFWMVHGSCRGWRVMIKVTYLLSFVLCANVRRVRYKVQSRTCLTT